MKEPLRNVAVLVDDLHLSRGGDWSAKLLRVFNYAYLLLQSRLPHPTQGKKPILEASAGRTFLTQMFLLL